MSLMWHDTGNDLLLEWKDRNWNVTYFLRPHSKKVWSVYSVSTRTMRCRTSSEHLFEGFWWKRDVWFPQINTATAGWKDVRKTPLCSIIWGVLLWATAEEVQVFHIPLLLSVSSPLHLVGTFPPSFSSSWWHTAAAATPSWAGTAGWRQTLSLQVGSTPALPWWQTAEGRGEITHRPGYQSMSHKVKLLVCRWIRPFHSKVCIFFKT